MIIKNKIYHRLMDFIIFVKSKLDDLLLVVFYFSLICFFADSSQPVGNIVVSSVYSLTQVFGMVIVLLVPAYYAYFVFSDKIPGVLYIRAFLLRLFSSILLYFMILWIIGNMGNSFYDWGMQHPHNALAVFFVVVILLPFAYFSLFGLRGGSLSALSNESLECARLSSDDHCSSQTSNPVLSEHDMRCAAIHEMGHALVYAAIGAEHLPKTIVVRLNTRLSTDGNIGHVSGLSTPHILHSQTLMEWYMLFFLAGSASEMAILSKSLLGSSEDYEKWLNFAHIYLSEQKCGVYYNRPSNSLEMESNERKITALREHHFSILHRFLTENQEIIKKGAEQLYKYRRLGHDDLLPLLSAIYMPEEFPHPDPEDFT